jgi:signal transduction histidine kinase
MQRLRSYERELSHWIFVKADEHRFQALGEIAGLIAHDLSSPTHSMAFCAEQLAETPELAKDPRYIQTLLVSAERMSDLVTSLRSYLTVTAPDDAASQMASAMTQVLRLLGIQFRRDGFAAIDITMDPQLSSVALRIRQADLIHILINLLSNSVKNLLEHHINNPAIAITQAAIDDDWVTIHIRDNGTGLSLESFERLTAFAFLPSTPTAQQGLGLRLIRRLAERAGGSLSLVPPSDQAGSTMALRLRRAMDTSRP